MVLLVGRTRVKGLPPLMQHLYRQKVLQNSKNNPKKNRDVKCFQCQGLGHYAYECPNKKVMILRDGEYISESEVEKGEESEDDEEEVEKTLEGELLMIRRLLGHQLKSMEESQRENIFHTRCLLNAKFAW